LCQIDTGPCACTDPPVLVSHCFHAQGLACCTHTDTGYEPPREEIVTLTALASVADERERVCTNRHYGRQRHRRAARRGAWQRRPPWRVACALMERSGWPLAVHQSHLTARAAGRYAGLRHPQDGAEPAAGNTARPCGRRAARPARSSAGRTQGAWARLRRLGADLRASDRRAYRGPLAPLAFREGVGQCWIAARPLPRPASHQRDAGLCVRRIAQGGV
jgi:hypothetical protein